MNQHISDNHPYSSYKKYAPNYWKTIVNVF